MSCTGSCSAWFRVTDSRGRLTKLAEAIKEGNRKQAGVQNEPWETSRADASAESSVGLSRCLGCVLSLKSNNSLFKEKNMKEGRKDWKYQGFSATITTAEGRLPLKAYATESNK